MNKNLILIVLTAAVVSVLNAAVVTTSTTPPFVGGYSESNLVPATGNPLKWYSGVEHDAGQTFTPSAETLFKSFTIHLNGSNPNDGADEWVLVRLGTITRPGDVFTFTDFYSEEAHWDMDWFADDYVTFTFDVPQVLNAGVEYGIILDAQAMGAWQQGIPYIKTAPGYPGGHAIARGAPVQSNVGDMVFHAIWLTLFNRPL